MKKILFLIITYAFFMFFPLCIFADQSFFIPEHGKYSSQYLSDWSNLANGKKLGKKNVADIPFKKAYGIQEQRKFINKKIATLKDTALSVRWFQPHDKYKTTLFYFKNCKKVVVDNVSIIQSDHNYRAAHSIFIENCDTVIIKNSYFSGTTKEYHIRVEGCKNVFIDNVEIEGFDYKDEGIRSGGGILINNGDPIGADKTTSRGFYDTNALDLEFCVIQNCYIHDNINVDEKRNQDGILIHSASNGILFNNYFENWNTGDAALDVSHRRSDEKYNAKLFRIERNIFKSNNMVKTVGTSRSTNKLLWTNNLFQNTALVDYHTGWDSWHVHESYIFDDSSKDIFFKIWGIKNGLTYFRNCLLYVDKYELSTMFYQGYASEQNQYQNIQPDYFVYIMQEPSAWVRGREQKIKSWSEWRTGSRDKNSILIDLEKCFANKGKEDFRLLSKSKASNFGSNAFVNHKDVKMIVSKDFNGNNRPKKPSVGAFEVIY